MERLASPLANAAPGPGPAAVSHADDFATMVEALADPRCYPHPAERFERIETHISVVLPSSWSWAMSWVTGIPDTVV